MSRTFLIKPEDCLSTHMGYVYGSYWDGDDIVCGHCGYRIKSPPPSGAHYVIDKKFLCFETKGHWEDKWPDFILGERGEKYE